MSLNVWENCNLLCYRLFIPHIILCVVAIEPGFVGEYFLQYYRLHRNYQDHLHLWSLNKKWLLQLKSNTLWCGYFLQHLLLRCVFLHLLDKFEKATLSNVAPFIVVSQDSLVWKFDRISGYVETWCRWELHVMHRLIFQDHKDNVYICCSWQVMCHTVMLGVCDSH